MPAGPGGKNPAAAPLDQQKDDQYQERKPRVSSVYVCVGDNDGGEGVGERALAQPGAQEAARES